MRSFVSQVFLAIALFALALVAWMAGNVERSVADARERMALLQYDRLDGAYDNVEQAMGYLRRVPWLSAIVAGEAGLDEQRAAADYWRARYAALGGKRDTGAGDAAGQDPQVMALATNASYRADERGSANRQEVLHRFDLAVKSYGDLVKKDPENADAAYNFEYVIRARDAAAKGKPQAKREAPRPGGLVMAGDLPAGRTMYGDPGAPPPVTDAAKFKIVVPKREDERGPGDKAGDGKLKVRRG